MAMLLPRIRLDDETATKLRSMADADGVEVGAVIAGLIESALAERPEPDADGRDALYRLVMVGERMGMGVGGPTPFPADWVRLGGLTRDECREIAEGYMAWRRNQNETTGGRQAASGGP